MQLEIHGIPRTFIPIAVFRQQHGLPATFGVDTFQPKDWAGLGSIDGATDALNRVRDMTLAGVPSQVNVTAWLGHVPEMTATFEMALVRANDAIGLREDEIVFATNGFGDVCNAYAFALVRSTVTDKPAPDFDTVYREWLYGTVSLGGVRYPYLHNDATWTVRTVHHAYGRVGLEVDMGEQTVYVVDKALACPAEGFMVGLLRAVVAAMTAATI
jgi:hypothetical protein